MFYLVTKKLLCQRSIYKDVWVDLIELRNVLLTLDIWYLAIVKLACRFDDLDWRVVRRILKRCSNDEFDKGI